MSILVNQQRDFGTDITVQFINDGYVDYCSHAGAKEEVVGYGFDDSQELLCCDKCSAQLVNGEWL